MKKALVGLLVFIASFLIGQFDIREVTAMASFQMTSPVFRHNQMIPSKYTCDGVDVNPPLLIGNTPAAAKSLVLIVDDPDAQAGTWVHWVLWNIDTKTTEVGENSVPDGAHQGTNDFRTQRYGGPCPPSGMHRYFFKLYALDTILDPGKGATKAALERSMKGHIIAQAELIGLYTRK